MFSGYLLSRSISSTEQDKDIGDIESVMVDRFDSRRMSSGHRYTGGQGGQDGGHRYRGTSYGGSPGDRTPYGGVPGDRNPYTSNNNAIYGSGNAVYGHGHGHHGKGSQTQPSEYSQGHYGQGSSIHKKIFNIIF